MQKLFYLPIRTVWVEVPFLRKMSNRQVVLSLHISRLDSVSDSKCEDFAFQILFASNTFIAHLKTLRNNHDSNKRIKLKFDLRVNAICYYLIKPKKIAL